MADIASGRYATWADIHEAYARMWNDYPLQKQRHAFSVLQVLLNTPRLDFEAWSTALEEAVRIQRFVCQQVYESRKKDYDDPFRQMVYSTPEEMAAVLGTAEGNSFVKQVRKETLALAEEVAKIKNRG